VLLATTRCGARELLEGTAIVVLLCDDIGVKELINFGFPGGFNVVYRAIRVWG
jgi:hypothetical protein